MDSQTDKGKIESEDESERLPEKKPDTKEPLSKKVKRVVEITLAVVKILEKLGINNPTKKCLTELVEYIRKLYG